MSRDGIGRQRDERARRIGLIEFNVGIIELLLVADPDIVNVEILEVVLELDKTIALADDGVEFETLVDPSFRRPFRRGG